MSKKVSIIGAGNVGSLTASRIVEKELADVVLIDIVPGKAKGKALDILDSQLIIGFESIVTGTCDYQKMADSDLIVVTAGIPRKPGMTRNDLLLTNGRIIKDITHQILRYAPESIIIIVTNPLDAMTQLVIETGSFPKNQVLGQSGVLDSSRFKNLIAKRLGYPCQDIFAMVLGSHDENMVPIFRFTSGKKTEIRPEIIAEIKKDTIKRGQEIVNLLKNGSASIAPSAAVLEMVRAVLMDKKTVLPCSTYLKGEYGIHDVVIGVPVSVGKRGAEQVIEIELTAEEKSALKKSAKGVKKSMGIIRKELKCEK